MKTTLLLSVICFVTTLALGSARADGMPPAKKKSINIEFDGKTKPTHRLSKTEIMEQSAYIRHLKRLRADYNQPIPDFR